MKSETYSYEADRLSFIVDVAFDEGSPVTNFTGAGAEAFARGSSGPAIEGVATVTGAAEITVSFEANALRAGVYQIQVRVTPVGHDAKTVLQTAWTVGASFGAA